jgi:hypothetical protein
MSGAIKTGTWCRASTAANADKRLRAGAIRVLNGLGRFADEFGYCFPSVETIAAACAMSERQVRYHLRTLEQFGYIEIDPRLRSKAGGSGSNGYQLLFPPPPPLPGRAPTSDMQPIAARDVQPIAGRRAEHDQVAADNTPPTCKPASHELQSSVDATCNGLSANYPIELTQIEPAQIGDARARAREGNGDDVAHDASWLGRLASAIVLHPPTPAPSNQRPKPRINPFTIGKDLIER